MGEPGGMVQESTGGVEDRFKGAATHSFTMKALPGRAREVGFVWLGAAPRGLQGSCATILVT
jgi:hypothetical protein